MNKMLAAARCFAEACFSVIPIRADGTKAPALSSWKDYQERQATEQEIEEWFSWDELGLAVVCGAVSNNLEILDFDEPGLYDQFAAICSDTGMGDLLDRLPLVETPSGGHHLYYRSAEPVAGNQKLAETGERKTRIETRGEGGYAIAPPSPAACHTDGRSYRFQRGRPHSVPTIAMHERASLLSIARLFNEYVDLRTVVDAPMAAMGARAAGALRPGDDYNGRGDYEAVLETHGWRRMGGRGDTVLWQRPGKTGHGISATSNYAGSRLFYVFSTNAAPFETNRAYSPFAVYTLLEHGGNFAAAAQDLSEQSYGDVQPKLCSRASGVATPPVPAQARWPDPPDDAAYYGLAGDIVRAIEPHTESDPIAILGQFLVGFGNLIGRGPYFSVEADRHYTNLFACLVGVTAKARKGTSLGHVRRLLEAVEAGEDGWAAQRVKSGMSSGEGLIHAVRDDREEDKRLLTVEPEFATVLRAIEREGNTISGRLRDAWDTGNLFTLTKQDPLKATGAHISVIGHITADELRRYLQRTETANGFANRFLWLAATRSKLLPDGGNLSQEKLAPLVQRLREAVTFARSVGQVRRDERAREIWHAVYGELSADVPGLLGAVTSRAEAQVTRLALLYALLDQSNIVRAEHLKAALAFWEYAEASARYIFGDAQGDSVADEILRALKSTPGGMTRTGLRDLFARNLSAKRVGQALDLLLAAGLVRAEMRTTGGRQAEVWFAV